LGTVVFFGLTSVVTAGSGLVGTSGSAVVFGSLGVTDSVGIPPQIAEGLSYSWSCGLSLVDAGQ